MTFEWLDCFTYQHEKDCGCIDGDICIHKEYPIVNGLNDYFEYAGLFKENKDVVFAAVDFPYRNDDISTATLKAVMLDKDCLKKDDGLLFQDMIFKIDGLRELVSLFKDDVNVSILSDFYGIISVKKGIHPANAITGCLGGCHKWLDIWCDCDGCKERNKENFIRREKWIEENRLSQEKYDLEHSEDKKCFYCRREIANVQNICDNCGFHQDTKDFGKM